MGRWYDRRAMVLIAFLVGLALVAAGAALLVVQALGFWRQVKSTGGAFGAELSLFDERSARTERVLAESDRASRDLELALDRLRVSRARLQVLLAALDRAQARVRWLRALLPTR
jgi:hypothetical protein